jgi:hypothetical protein
MTLLSLPSHAHQQVGALIPTRDIRNIRVRRQSGSNFPTSLNLAYLHQPIPAPRDGLADDVRTLGLTFRADDVGLALLLGPFDDEPRTLGILLSDLLLLHSPRELLAEGHVRDADVLKGDVELARPLGKVGADALRDGLALGDQLGGVELGDDGFEDFVADGGEDALVVILTEGLQVVSVCAEERHGGVPWT